MGEKRALLVGVAEYRHKRYERVNGGLGEPIDKNMPSASADVAAFQEMLEGEGFDTVALTNAADTTRDSIVAAVDLLLKDLQIGSQVVFYFSGHSVLVSQNIIASIKDEALCPSDTTWNGNVITDHDLMKRISELPRNAASVEIILETCSASGMQDEQLTRRYASSRPALPIYSRLGRTLAPPVGLAGSVPSPPSGPDMRDVTIANLGGLLNGRCVFWGASSVGTSSYSGPENPRGSGEVGGLFTRYFIDGFKRGLDRKTLKSSIQKRLDDYQSAHREWHRDGTRIKVRCMSKRQVPYVDYLDGLDDSSPLAGKAPIVGW